MLISIIGPDGSGKTTLMEGLAEALTLRGCRVTTFELNFRAVPRLRDIAEMITRRKIGRSHEAGAKLAGMTHPPNGTLSGWLYALWYSVDYFVGRIIHHSALRREVVIFARYTPDYHYQRSHASMHRLARTLIEWAAPAPDITLMVGRDAEQIFFDKPELAVDEIRRQQSVIIDLLEGSPTFFVIESTSADEALRAALDIIERLESP